MAGTEASQRRALKPEDDVRRRAETEPALLSATHRKRQTGGVQANDEGSVAGGNPSCVAIHFVLYSTYPCGVSGQKVSCPQQERLELVVVQRSGYLVSGPPRAKWFRCKGVEVEAYYVNQDRTPDRARNRR